MKLRSGWLLRKIAGTNIVIPVAERVIEFKGMITLNETGTFIWELLKDEHSEEELVRMVTEEYEVSADRAAEDVKGFLEQLRDKNILDEA